MTLRAKWEALLILIGADTVGLVATIGSIRSTPLTRGRLGIPGVTRLRQHQADTVAHTEDNHPDG
jgi:hypothetical protein